MPNERLELDIVSDDSKSAPVVKRANESFEKLESTGVRAGKAIGTAISATHAVLLKSLGGIESLAAGTTRASNEIRAAFLSVTSTVATYYAAVSTATAYTYAHAQATIGLQNVYRGLRISISAVEAVITGSVAPVILTSTGLAAAYVAETMLHAAYATGKLSLAQALFSERNKITIKELQELRVANQDLGLAPGTLEGARAALKKQFTGESTSKAAKAVFDDLGLDKTKGYTDSLRDIAVAFGEIEDPLDKARKAVALFGDDAEKYLPILNSRIDDTIVKLNEMGVVLGEDSAREFASFSRDVDLIKNKLVEFGKTVGLAVTAPISGLIQALKDPALKALLQKGGLALGQGIIDFAPDPTGGSLRDIFLSKKPISAEERENQRRNTFTDAEFRSEVTSLQGSARGSQISELQDKLKTLSGFSNQTAEVKARIADLTAGIATLKRLQEGSTGLVNDVLFGGKPPALVDAYRNSLDGLNGKLSVLKGERTSLVSTFDKLSTEGKALAITQLQTLNRDIELTEKKVKVLENQGQTAEKVAAAEKRASEILLEAKKHEFTGLGAIVQTYREYVALLGLSRKANLDLSQAVVIRLRAEVEKEQRKSAKEAIKDFQDTGTLRLAAGAKDFQDDLKFADETLQLQIKTIDEIFDHQQVVNQQNRDSQLQGLEALNAQTLRQKLAVESAKFGIEQDYFNKSAILEIEKIDRVARQDVQSLQARLDAKLITEEQFASRRDAILNESGQQAKRIEQDTGAAIDSARNSAAIKSVGLIRDNTRSIFDSIKHSSEGLFDAMTAKGQTAFQAIGSFFKNAMLTAIKEIVSSQVAKALTQLVTGQSVTFSGQGNTGPFAGIRNALGSLGLGTPPTIGASGSKLEQTNHIGDVLLRGGGAVPVVILNQNGQQSVQQAGSLATAGGLASLAGLVGIFSGAGKAGTGGSIVSSTISSGGNIIGGGSTTYPGTPPFLPPGTGAASGGSAGGLGGLLGGLKGGGLDLLTQLGQIGATNKMFQGGVYGAKGGALLAGGGILAFDGLRRGGLVGLGEATAGGALIGAKFGGPVGALIGAAAGAIAGTIRLFIKGAEEKAIQKIKDAYHLNIDKSMATQIVAIAKANYGGNLDVAIRSTQVRDLLQLYAMSTGQQFGVQAQLRAVSLTDTSSGLTQNALYENSKPISFAGLLPVNGGLSTTPIPTNPANASGGNFPTGGQVNIQASLTLPADAVNDAFNGRTVQVIQTSPRTVSQANAAGTAQNAGRRQVQASLLAPGLLTQ